MEILGEKIHVWLDSARFVKAKPGVYVLYDRKLEAIYIGESDNLQNEFANTLTPTLRAIHASKRRTPTKEHLLQIRKNKSRNYEEDTWKLEEEDEWTW